MDAKEDLEVKKDMSEENLDSKEASDDVMHEVEAHVDSSAHEHTFTGSKEEETPNENPEIKDQGGGDTSEEMQVDEVSTSTLLAALDLFFNSHLFF